MYLLILYLLYSIVYSTELIKMGMIATDLLQDTLEVLELWILKENPMCILHPF